VLLLPLLGLPVPHQRGLAVLGLVLCALLALLTLRPTFAAAAAAAIVCLL
jgi:hypothetical protein